jgi:hypothetical protein
MIRAVLLVALLSGCAMPPAALVAITGLVAAGAGAAAAGTGAVLNVEQIRAHE